MQDALYVVGVVVVGFGGLLLFFRLKGARARRSIAELARELGFTPVEDEDSVVPALIGQLNGYLVVLKPSSAQKRIRVRLKYQLPAEVSTSDLAANRDEHLQRFDFPNPQWNDMFLVRDATPEVAPWFTYLSQTDGPLASLMNRWFSSFEPRVQAGRKVHWSGLHIKREGIVCSPTRGAKTSHANYLSYLVKEDVLNLLPVLVQLAEILDGYSKAAGHPPTPEADQEYLLDDIRW